MHRSLKLNNVAKKMPAEILLSVCEGVWQGIVVSGVIVVSSFLIKCATDFFFA